MNIQISVVTYYGKNLVEPRLIEIHREVLAKMYCEALKSLRLSALESIVVPEDYKAKLFDIQTSVGKQRFVTGNEYANGVAQTICKDNGKYVIILDKEVLFPLYPEETFNQIMEIHKNSPENLTLLYETHIQSIYIVWHEFSHIDEMEQRKSIAWICKTPKLFWNETRRKKVLSIWAEYYASRKASVFYKTIATEEYIEFSGHFKELSRKIWDMRIEYNEKLCSTDDFIEYFEINTSFLLRRLANLYGTSYYYKEHRQKKLVSLIKPQDPLASNVFDEFFSYLNTLYEIFPAWESESVINPLLNSLDSFYDLFNIRTSAVGKGIYYDIPPLFNYPNWLI